MYNLLPSTGILRGNPFGLKTRVARKWWWGKAGGAVTLDDMIVYY
jgi:hypothetical protein